MLPIRLTMDLLVVVCGIITVVTNNSGPIFNIYLLACGLDMNQARVSNRVRVGVRNP